MATAKPIASTPSLGPPKRRVRKLILLAVVIAAALVAWFWRPLNSHAVAGTSYGARVTCSCRFIEGRSLSDCRKDFRPDMALVRVSEDDEAKSVTASFPLISRQTATFQEGSGCLLEKWD